MDATPLTVFNRSFLNLQVFLSCSEDVHLVLELSSRYFFINFFFHIFDLVFFVFFVFFLFSGHITIRIDTLLAQLLGFYIDNFETMHIWSTWSVDVHVVLGLSSCSFLSTFSTFST